MSSELPGRAFRWRGSKARIAAELLPHFAKAKHYIEPFLGAGGMFFSIPKNIYAGKTINDLDKSLVQFFSVLRSNPVELQRLCLLTPYSRDEYLLSLEDSTDPLEQARRIWVRNIQGWLGDQSSIGHWASARKLWHDYSGAAAAKAEQFQVFAEFLRGTQIENMDATQLVGDYASKETFIYCDPPYAQDARAKKATYAHEMSDAQQRSLSVALKDAVSSGAKVAVSGYRSALYEELYGSWRTYEFSTRAMSNGDGAAEDMDRTEVLWVSYAPLEELGPIGRYLRPRARTRAEEALLRGSR